MKSRLVRLFEATKAVFACAWLSVRSYADRAALWLADKRTGTGVYAANGFGGQDATHIGGISVWPDASITVRHLLYKKGAGTNAPGSLANLSVAALAAQTDVPLYVVADEWSSTATPGQPVAGLLLGGQNGTLRMVANASGLTVGDIVYGVATGYVDKKANLTTSSTAYAVGQIVSLPAGGTSTAAQGEVIEVQPCAPVLTTT